MAIPGRIGETRPSRGTGRSGFSRRWAWVAVPMVAILGLEAIQDTVPGGIILPSPVHLAVLAILLLVGAGLVAGTIFRRFDRLARELELQNDELRVRGAAMSALQEAAWPSRAWVTWIGSWTG